MRTVPQNTYTTVGMFGPTTIVEPCNPWGLHPYPNLNFLFDTCSSSCIGWRNEYVEPGESKFFDCIRGNEIPDLTLDYIRNLKFITFANVDTPGCIGLTRTSEFLFEVPPFITTDEGFLNNFMSESELFEGFHLPFAFQHFYDQGIRGVNLVSSKFPSPVQRFVLFDPGIYLKGLSIKKSEEN